MQGTNFSGTDADHEGVWEYGSLISFLGGGSYGKHGSDHSLNLHFLLALTTYFSLFFLGNSNTKRIHKENEIMQ